MSHRLHQHNQSLTTSFSSNNKMLKKITYLTRQQNTQLDSLLMGKYSFLSQTLMQLAGLSIAQITHHHLSKKHPHPLKSIAILVGPGNNGGDGLVAGRHLKMMNYDVNLFLFKKLQNKNGNFLTLCQHNNIPYCYVQQRFMKLENPLKGFVEEMRRYDLVVDAVFGFPFQGEMREPYRTLVPGLKEVEERVLAVDIPSGWDADLGNTRGLFTPGCVVSLGMPKLAMKGFKGRHFLGGRFIPGKLAEEMNIQAPEYEGAELYREITNDL